MNKVANPLQEDQPHVHFDQWFHKQGQIRLDWTADYHKIPVFFNQVVKADIWGCFEPVCFEMPVV